jgi:hypothetical protein
MQPYRDMLRTHIDTAARGAGLRVRTGSRAPDLQVLAPVDANKAAASLVALNPMLFGDPTDGMASRLLLAILRLPHAVRWFSSTRVAGQRSGMWRLQSQVQAVKNGRLCHP